MKTMTQLNDPLVIISAVNRAGREGWRFEPSFSWVTVYKDQAILGIGHDGVEALVRAHTSNASCELDLPGEYDLDPCEACCEGCETGCAEGDEPCQAYVDYVTGWKRKHPDQADGRVFK